MLYFPRIDDPILTLHPQSDVCWLCEQHFKSKEKVSTITSVGFKTLKEYTKKWTAVEKDASRFQNFHLILDDNKKNEIFFVNKLPRQFTVYTSS